MNNPITPVKNLTPASKETGFAFAADMSINLVPYSNRAGSQIARSICYAIGCAASRELERICKGYK